MLNEIANKKDLKNAHLFDNRSLILIKSYIIDQSYDVGGVNIWGFIRDLPNEYENRLDELNKLIERYYIFSSIDNFDKTIVMVGANGSGKSTFARFLKNSILGDNVIVLAAQHSLNCKNRNNISLQGNELYSVHEFQKKDKMPNDYEFNRIFGSDMERLVSAVCSNYAAYTDQKFRGNILEQNPYIIDIIDLWNNIIKDRTLHFEDYKLFVSGNDINNYEFNDLSDGEKSVFYYIAHTIIAPLNSYIIIDEPENHLNLNVCRALWDTLEEKRSDCKFIFLTHNIDFVLTRLESTILWNKSFNPPYGWDFVELPQSDTLPKELIMEIVGSRRNILFCEGTKDSIDYQIYSSLFPNLKVVPVNGHNEVIESVKAFNKQDEFTTKAVGIIDGDFHLPEQIDKWEAMQIYTLPVSEIENILCDKKIIESAIEKFYSEPNSINNYMDKFWEKMNENKENMANTYVKEYINNLFKENCLSSKKYNGLKQELLDLANVDNLDKKYNEIYDKIDEFIRKEDYNSAIKFMNLKGTITKGVCNSTIVPGYEERVIRLIKHDDELVKYIKSEYFGKFVEILNEL